MQNPTRRDGPPLRKCGISRAGAVHRSGNAEFHAQGWSTAQEMRNPTRWNSPPLGNTKYQAREKTSSRENKITNAEIANSSGNTKSHSQGRSTAQENTS